MAFVKAVRELVWLKILMAGPSGCGKSKSALRVAEGLAKKCNSGIAYIGTEGSRDLYYADDHDYDLLQLEPPFSIDKYASAIDEAVASGYKVCIIDSLSMEWKWLNEQHDKMPGNSFQNWGKLKPIHQAFMDKILQAPMHIICTARGKDEWVLEEQNNKKVPKKVGLGTQSDKDLAYNMTISFMIDQNTHIASADKDNTGLYQGVYEVLTEKDGEKLWEWANAGKAPAKKPKEVNIPTTDTDTLGTLHADIIAECTRLGGTKNATLMTKLKEYTTNGNPKQIKDVAKATELLEELKKMEA